MGKLRELDSDARTLLEYMVRETVQRNNTASATDMTEDEAVESCLRLIDQGLVEIVCDAPDAQGNFSYTVMPTTEGRIHYGVT